VPKQYFENCCDYIAQSVYCFYDLIISPYILSSADSNFVYYELQVFVCCSYPKGFGDTWFIQTEVFVIFLSSSGNFLLVSLR
jgi:hypothetical protein